MTLSLKPKQRSRTAPEDQGASPLTPRPAPTARYSRFVGLMRVLLPGLAVALLGVLLAWPKLSGRDESAELALGDLKGSGAERPSMINPRYFGTDSSDQPYVVTADLARALDREATAVALDAPTAKIALRSGAEVSLGAKTGTYRQGEQTIDLVGGVVLNDACGYAMRTEEARIDLAESGASGSAPVQGEGPFGTLEAEGFAMTDKGRTINFTGRSHAVLHPARKDRP